jgi:Tfp pilus assembly protein PilW
MFNFVKIRKQLTHGFTIVEILVIAPIVILVIGIFIGVIVNMTGEVLSTRGANVLSYNIQDALNRIEQDVKLSGAFLATNNIALTSPQGYNNDTTNFHNIDSVNGTMLILNAYATTSNPLASKNNFAYQNSPNACNSSQVNQNPTVMINIIYFVKSVNGVNTLWRRVVVPSNYATIGCAGTSIGIPWQQSSCAPNISGTICKTQDIELVDGITVGGFSVKYYPSASSTTENTTASDNSQTDSVRQIALQTAGTVEIAISATNTVAGRDISQSGTMRVTSPDNNIKPTGNQTVKVLVVAGGGGGGTNMGGGGGGGGVIYNPSYAVTSQAYSITIGLGGNGAPAGTGAHPSIPGTNGGNSVFDTLTAIGGGWGGTSYNSYGLGIHFGHSGGSGGGSSGYNNDAVAPGYYGSGAGTGGQGYRGGLQGNAYYSGGGGGAGGAGADGNSQANGGPGIASSILGTTYYWGGGGGGAGYTICGGNGGVGGGGGGAVCATTGGLGLNNGSAGGGGVVVAQTNTPGGNAGANTGGGGGAGAHYNYTNKGGDGGSGIVIISYPTGTITATGGTITHPDAYTTVHKFTSSGTFTIN